VVQSTNAGNVEAEFPNAQVAQDAQTGSYRTVVSKTDVQAAIRFRSPRSPTRRSGLRVRDTVRSTTYNGCAGAMVIMSRKKGSTAKKRPGTKTV
jgi:hypothetical protein